MELTCQAVLINERTTRLLKMIRMLADLLHLVVLRRSKKYIGGPKSTNPVQGNLDSNLE